MKREFKVEANVGKPQGAYRETIRAKVESEASSYASRRSRPVRISVVKLEPNEQGKATSSSRDHLAAVCRASTCRRWTGIKEAVRRRIAGYPIVDVKVRCSTARTTTSTNEMALRSQAPSILQGRFRRAEARTARADHGRSKVVTRGILG